MDLFIIYSFNYEADRIAAGETTVVSTAAVLRCGKQMEKLPHYNFSWTVSLSKKNMRDASSGDKLKIALFGELSLEEAMDLWRDRQILDLNLIIPLVFFGLW
jgi:hypothetical protein